MAKLSLHARPDRNTATQVRAKEWPRLFPRLRCATWPTQATIAWSAALQDMRTMRQLHDEGHVLKYVIHLQLKVLRQLGAAS